MYPKKHKQIVTALMDGKFITVDEFHFDVVKEHQAFYTEFFKESFGFELKGTQEFFYLLSADTNENTSRDISIFFAVLCYELDKDGKNFIEELTLSEFQIGEIIEYFKNSAWTDIIKSNKSLNSPDNIKKLIGNTMAKRNIAHKVSDEKYTFTKAYKLFIEFARELTNSETNQVNA